MKLLTVRCSAAAALLIFVTSSSPTIKTIFLGIMTSRHVYRYVPLCALVWQLLYILIGCYGFLWILLYTHLGFRFFMSKSQAQEPPALSFFSEGKKIDSELIKSNLKCLT